MDFVTLYIAGFIFINTVIAQECHLNTRDDLPKEYQPLYLKSNTFMPVEPVKESNKQALVVKKGDNITLACNGEGNYLLSGGKPVSNAVCDRQGVFSIEGRDVTLNTLTCKNPVKSTLKLLNLTCGQNAKLYEVGFEINSSWLKVLRACYDIHIAATRYVQHVVHPSVQEGAVQGNSRPSFKEGIQSLFKGLSMATLYKKNRQKDMLERQLGTDEYMEAKDQYLARGHLAADADFLYSSFQHATYFFINVVPQWQSINSGNWALLERRIRQIASKKGRKASVTTGTQGVLKLNDSGGVPQSIYLENESARVPVPLYVWKAVIIDSEGIVFISSNNPFDGLPKPPICKDICPLHGWKFGRDVKLGKIICCTVQEAKTVLQFMPNIKANAILSWR